MKKKIYKNVIRMIAALLMFATVITATAMPVEAAKRRGTNPEILLNWLGAGWVDSKKSLLHFLNLCHWAYMKKTLLKAHNLLHFTLETVVSWAYR